MEDICVFQGHEDYSRYYSGNSTSNLQEFSLSYSETSANLEPVRSDRNKARFTLLIQEHLVVTRRGHKEKHVFGQTG